jgi:hypothetical protein
LMEVWYGMAIEPSTERRIIEDASSLNVVEGIVS